MPRDKVTGEVVAPRYDRELAERAMASTELIQSGCGINNNRMAGVRHIDTRAEYELFRPIQNLPRQQRDIVEACMNAYHRIGLLRNVIDMMASFGCQGIQVVHQSKAREKIYKAWFNKVRGPERSERFLNGLYRAGNVIVKRNMAKLSPSDMRDLQRTVATLEVDAVYERQAKTRKNEIPIEYIFLNPGTIEMAGGELATFLGHPTYTLKIPNFIITMIKTPKSPTQKQMVADLPEFIRKPIQAGEKFITLDNDKLAVFHYMKDDWQQWALPVTYSILADLILYEKMKLADMAALEGAISHIRIWKLGSLEHEIQVGPALHQKLNDMLLSNVGGGAMDLIWDAAIDLQETGSEVSKFLGSEKYEPVLKSIFAGLGIPASLAGGGQGAGFTNNAISLKTLIERLQYGRDLLTEFWNNELNIMQEALGDSKPARIVFDNMSLYDEAAEKMLWFQMYDRQLVDDATMQEKFGLIPEVVSMRIKREETQRSNGTKPPKASPFHDPQTGHELAKIALQQGTLAPTEAGVEKLPKKAGDKSIIDHQTEQAAKDRALQKQQQDAQVEMDKQRLEVEKKQGQDLHNQKLHQNDEQHQLKLKHTDQEHKAMLPVKVQTMKKKSQQQLQNQKKGVPGQGRPKNSRDSGPRKTRTPSPSSKAVDMFALQQWAKDTLVSIADHTTREYLDANQVKNARSLSSAQAEELESHKFNCLCHTAPFSKYTPGVLQDASLPSSPQDAMDIYNDLVSAYIGREGVEPPIDKKRDMQASAYSIWHSQNY